MHSIVDKKILPKEFGGEVESEVMIKEFKILAKERLSALRAIDDISVDVEFIKKNSENEIGSFRKLEID